MCVCVCVCVFSLSNSLFFSSNYNQVIVTAFADNTDVNFLISDGNMTTSTLKAFQSYNLLSEEDLSGTLVTASKPVSVLVGVEVASIPSKVF